MNIRYPSLHRIHCETLAHDGSFADDSETARAAMQRGEPAKSTFYTVGRFVIPKRAYGRAIREASALAHSIGCDIHNGDDTQYWAHETRGKSFLEQFLGICTKQLQKFALRDIGNPETPLFVSAAAGPYTFLPEDHWHRDDFPNALTFKRKYLATIYGPTTRFLEGEFGETHFDKDMLAIEPQRFHETEVANKIITLHNESTTVHAAPNELHNNETRITVTAYTLRENSL